MNRTAKTTKIATCFGHVSKPGEPVLTDALSAMLAHAPVNYLDQWQEGERQRGVEAAEGLIARAILRVSALRTHLSDRADPTVDAYGQEACRAAHLLIAADLVAALLADDSKTTFEHVKHGIGLVLPDVRERSTTIELDVESDRAMALGMYDLAQGMTANDFQQITQWFRLRRTGAPDRHTVIGFFSDVAVVHEALFSAVDGREFDLPDTGLSPRARRACLIAVAFSLELANREPDARGILLPCKD
jgi:hypothetical protein